MSRSLAIRDITDKQEWEQFVQSLAPATFLQSWNWGAMQHALKEDILRLGAYDGSTLVGVAFATSVTAKRGSFLFCPNGPLVRAGEDSTDIIGALLDALTARAGERGFAFLRVSPLAPNTPADLAPYAVRGFRPAPIHMHAETMWMLDIAPTENDILKGMRKTTRNLVRRSERDGVRIRFSTDPRDLAVFESVYSETAEREHFVPFSRDFLDAEFAAFAPDNQAFLGFAEHSGDILATALIVVYAGMGFYHQGASSRKNPKVPAAYLLHWEIIKELKRRGCRAYNFWGIAPTNDASHPWAGLTLFKQGFGGQRVDYVHAQDKPLAGSYWFTYLVERIRRWKRGL